MPKCGVISNSPERWNWLRPSLLAVRKCLLPVLLIHAVSIALVVAYFRIPALATWASSVGALKDRTGFVGAFIAGAIAGGILSEIAKAVTGMSGPWNPKYARRVAWTAFVYGVVGICIDGLYQLIALLFGHRSDVGMVLIKVGFDLLVYTPLVTIPLAAALLSWMKLDFARGFWKRAISWRFYKAKVLMTLPLCYAYWVPICCCLYALPLPIQFPFAVLMESAWSIMFVFLFADAGDSAEDW